MEKVKKMKLKPYPKYKDSGIKWIGKIPEGWGVRKLKHILNLKSGDSTKDLEEGKYNIYGANGIIGKCNKYKFHKKNILIGRVGASGSIVEAKGKYWVSDNVLIVILNKNNDYQFIKYKLISMNISDLANKTAQPLITATQIKNIITQIPKNIQEQTTIANFLDKKTTKIDALIEKDKKLIELLKERRTALINHCVTKGLPVRGRTQTGIDPNVKMKDSGIPWIGKIPAGWEVRKFSHIINLITKGTTPTSYGFEFEQEGVNFLKVESINEKGEFIPEMFAHISKECDDFLARSKIKEGDLLVSIAGALGRIAVANAEILPANVNQALAILRVNRKRMDLRYLFYYLQSYYISTVINLMSVKSAQSNLSMENIRYFKILIPPKYEQNKIVKRLDKLTFKIDKTIKLIERKIALLEEYKKSLIHHVVTGKVDVREVED